jgi:hypothetical protein
MRLLIISLSILCLFIECNKTKNRYNDPIIKSADIVYNSSPGICPSIVRTIGGDLIVTFVAHGDCVPGDSSQMVKSIDNGKTWSAPFKVFRNENPLGSRSVSLYNVPNGNWSAGELICSILDVTWEDYPKGVADPNWNSLVSSRKFESYYCFTKDDGNTFSEKKFLNDSKRNGFPQGGILELRNGDLIWPWGNWGLDPLNGFKRSTDGGKSWETTIPAWQDPPPGVLEPIGFNETAVIVCKNGKLLAIARVDGYNNNDKRFWQIISIDNGKTWSKPKQIDIQGGSPALYCTPSGQLWLAYRDGGIGPGLGLAVSDDNGENWRFLYHLKEPTGEHEKLYGKIKYTGEDRTKTWRPAEGIVGYPCFAKLSETEVYVVFHAMSRAMMEEKFPETPFYVVGNLLEIPR